MLYSCPFNLNKPTNRVLWEITGKCNMNCKHCLYFSNNNSPKDLSSQRIFEIIREMQEDNTINEVWLSGGEPLIREDIIGIIEAISNANMKPSISTNGYLVTQQVSKHLKECGVDYVHLSIDGVNSTVHDDFRRKRGAFEHVIKASDYLNQSMITVGATCIITNHNLIDIENIIHLALNHNIKVLSFYMVEPLGRGQIINSKLDISLMEELSAKFNELIKTYGSTLHLELFRATNEKSNILTECKCFNFYTITNDGKLGGCPWLMKSCHNPIEVTLTKNNFHNARNIVQNKLKNFINNRNDYVKNV